MGRCRRYAVRQLLMALVVAGVVAVPATGRAHDAYDDTQSHPLRLAAYAIHPIGYAAEWLVMRPIHFLVSQPNVEKIFGHTPHETPFGDYEAYQPDADE
jgi:hypothetical protein